MVKRIGFVSLGCAKNLVNSEQMMHLCVEAGYDVSGETENVDAVIVNTCGFIESAKKESIDTSSPTGKFMLTVFGAVAELERAYILERQREGIAIAKAKGVYKGRPPKELPDFDRIVTLWQVGEITAVEAARRLQINPSTFYRKLKGVKKQ